MGFKLSKQTKNQTMKKLLSLLLIATIPAVIGAASPASYALSNTMGQQQIGLQQETLLLAKGGEHTSNKSPSNLQKHQDGQAAKKKQQSTKEFHKAKQKNSHASKNSLRTNGSKKR